MKRLQENNKLFPHEKSQLRFRDQSFVRLSSNHEQPILDVAVSREFMIRGHDVKFFRACITCLLQRYWLFTKTLLSFDPFESSLSMSFENLLGIYR